MLIRQHVYGTFSMANNQIYVKCYVQNLPRYDTEGVTSQSLKYQISESETFIKPHIFLFITNLKQF